LAGLFVVLLLLFGSVGIAIAANAPPWEGDLEIV
jgi:hypothetical protein